MLTELDHYISIVFVLTCLLCFFFFYLVLIKSNCKRSTVNFIVILLTAWLLVQGILSWNFFYSENTMALPPRFLVLILPTLLLIIGLFASSKGRAFIASLPLAEMTYLNSVRVPVELVLYWLFLAGAIPELMTFEGRNFDILAGITAPFVAYWGIQQQKMSRRWLLLWNIVCLGLLLNIVIHAALSVPSALQQLALEQPNIAVLHFPFSWLPGFIVPIVLFGHLASIWQLSQAKK